MWYIYQVNRSYMFIERFCETEPSRYYVQGGNEYHLIHRTDSRQHAWGIAVTMKDELSSWGRIQSYWYNC